MTSAAPTPPRILHTGPFFTATDAAEFLGITPRDLDELADRHQVLRLPLADGDTPVYPAWQFTPTGKPLPSLGDVLAALATGTDDPWTWALWLCAPNPSDTTQPTWRGLLTPRAAFALIAEAHRDAARWQH